MNLDQTFQLDKHTTAETNILYLKGELGLAKASEFTSTIDPFVADTNRKLILDLKELQYLDSTGIGIILTVLKTRHALKASFAVEHIPSKIQKLFDITGMTPFLAAHSHTEN